MREVATALLFDKLDRLLIYLRDDNPNIPFPNHWDLFGGHIEENESPEMGLIREIEEELNIHVSKYKKFKCYECVEGDIYPNIKHVYVVYTDQLSEDLRLYEGQYHKAIKIEEFQSYKFANILSNIINDYISYVKG